MLFHTLRRLTPAWLRQIMPKPWKKWFRHQLTAYSSVPLDLFSHELVLPEGATEDSILKYLAGFRLENEPAEMHDYLEKELRRFLYTLALIPRGQGQLLEIGANPYFLSMLVRRFTQYELFCANFFGPDHPPQSVQVKVNAKGERETFAYRNFNIETDAPPYDAHGFDVVLFCEVLEHLTNDPLRALLNIKHLLKPRGCLVLTTPNVGRLENIAKMVAGSNIHDEYSRYGPYGRHNREYTVGEVRMLLNHAGFEIEGMFTCDVRENESNYIGDMGKLMDLLESHRGDFGQYIFVRARNAGAADTRKPRRLYRSYDPGETVA